MVSIGLFLLTQMAVAADAASNAAAVRMMIAFFMLVIDLVNFIPDANKGKKKFSIFAKEK